MCLCPISHCSRNVMPASTSGHPSASTRGPASSKNHDLRSWRSRMNEVLGQRVRGDFLHTVASSWPPSDPSRLDHGLLGPGPPAARQIHGAADPHRFAVPRCRRTACHILLPGAGLRAPRDARHVARNVPRRWAAGASGCPPGRYQASHGDARQRIAKLWHCASLVASLQVLVAHATRERRPRAMPNVRRCRQARACALRTSLWRGRPRVSVQCCRLSSAQSPCSHLCVCVCTCLLPGALGRYARP
jgi:hypothetical protein